MLDIIEIPNPLLRQKSEPVAEITPEIIAFMDDMLETMYAAPGVGLAAVQVGVLKRLIVVDVSGKDEPNDPIYLINPEIIWTSEELEECEEGCLSVPKQFAKVKRPAAIKVKYLNKQGEETVLETGDFLAVALQHEIDHLDGKLFTDHLSALKRKMLLNNLKKRRREETKSSE